MEQNRISEGAPLIACLIAHRIIRASLGLSVGHVDERRYPHLRQRVRATEPATLLQRLILEGEIVCYNESTNCIDEFWKLAYVKGGSDLATCADEESQASGSTGHTLSGFQQSRADDLRATVHLMIVWFDVLLVQEQSLLVEAYVDRRVRLQSLIREISGYVSCRMEQWQAYNWLTRLWKQSMLAEVTHIDFSNTHVALNVSSIRPTPFHMLMIVLCSICASITRN